jgi:hypothetical protein
MTAPGGAGPSEPVPHSGTTPHTLVSTGGLALVSFRLARAESEAN